MKIFIYITLIMILYDLFIHVVDWKGWHWRFIKSRSVLSYFYPHLRWQKNGDDPIERVKFQTYYDWFWTAYWMIAGGSLILFLVYN